MSKNQYLDGIASGTIDYRRFEPVSEISVLTAGELVVIRYKSQIDIEVQGQHLLLRCWHTDCYRRGHDGWQVVCRRQPRSNRVRPPLPHDPLTGAQHYPLGTATRVESQRPIAAPKAARSGPAAT